MPDSLLNREAITTALRDGFGHRKVRVIGDLILDRYLWGKAERISPEAPVPVLNPEREETRAGGAANVALNLRGLGLDVEIAGFTGADENREQLLSIFAEAGIDSRGVLALGDRSTVVKTRVIAGHQHILRVDAEDLSPLAGGAHERLLEALAAAPPADAIVLSDYAKGVLSPDFCQQVIRDAAHGGTPVVVDPKGRDYSKYTGADVLTPNVSELALAAGVPAQDAEALIRAGQSFVEELGLQYLVLTRGADGMTLISSDQVVHSPSQAREVFDVSGAGDTVIASITAALLGHLGPAEMLHMANLAAGYVVGRVGTAAIRQPPLMRVLHAEEQSLLQSAYALDELLDLVAHWRGRGMKVVFTNGCFDIIHAGHVAYLQKAAREGDRLIVGINTDRSVRELKGEGRPYNTEADRAGVIAALAAVDAVILFDELTPIDLITALRPDVLVKGADYTRDEVVGADEVEAAGGRVVLVPLVEGRSTSALIERLGP